MPFLSKKQARYAFATKQPWAEEFAKDTDFEKLPEKVKKKKKYLGGPEEDLPWPTNIRPVGPSPAAPDWGTGSYMHNSDPYLDALGKGIIEPRGERTDVPPPQQKKTNEWNPYFALRGFTTGASWLSGIMERGRQNNYMMDEFAQLQQRNAMPVNDFQPTNFSQYSKYGGRMEDGGSTTTDTTIAPNWDFAVSNKHPTKADSALYLRRFNGLVNSDLPIDVMEKQMAKLELTKMPYPEKSKKGREFIRKMGDKIGAYGDAIEQLKLQPKMLAQGGSFAEGGMTREEAAAFLFDDEEEQQMAPKVDASEEVTQDFSDANRREGQQMADDRRQQNLDIVLGEYFRGNGRFSRRGRGENGERTPNVKPKATNEEAQYAYNYYQQQGLAPHVAAGIVGNLMQESGLNTGAVGDGGKARGIAQWHPDRYAGLETWTSTKGRNVNDLNTQLDYVVEEAKKRGDLSKIQQTTNAGDAAYAFAKHFERPKTIDGQRVSYAKFLHPDRK